MRLPTWKNNRFMVGLVKRGTQDFLYNVDALSENNYKDFCNSAEWDIVDNSLHNIRVGVN